MKKKIITALTALMVLSMGTTVLAASPVPTVPAETYAKEVAAITTADGTKLDMEAAITATPAAEVVAIENIANAASTEKVEQTVVATFDLNVTGTNLTFTFDLPDVKAGDEITVYHFDGTKWETASVSNVVVANGKVTATFGSLSPIAFVKSEPTQAAKDEAALQAWIWANMQAGSNNATTAPTSPKTFDATLGLMAMAALCGAGAAVCNKKSK